MVSLVGGPNIWMPPDEPEVICRVHVYSVSARRLSSETSKDWLMLATTTRNVLL